MSKTYPTYKDSGIEWLGEVPEHWGVVRIKALIETFKGGIWGNEPEDNEEDVVCVRVADFDMNKFGVSTDDLTIRNVAERYQDGRSLQQGDLLIEKSGGGDQQLVGRVVEYDLPHEAVCSNFLGRISPRTSSVNSRYLLYYFQHLYSHDVNLRSIKQTTGIQNIDTDSYFDERVPLPPLEEQRTIAAYLDRKTAQIDRLIAKKQRLIDLLQEQRTAVINRAVTQGLDPDAPMQDSGIEWLGEVPAHWGLPKLKWITTKIGSGSTPRGGSEVYQDEGVIFLRSQNIQFDGLDLEDVAYISEDIHADMERSAVEPGDVLLNITGASIGRCTYVPRDFDPANVNQHVCIVRPMDVIMSEYLQMILASKVGQYQVFSLQDGSSREGLNFAQLGSFAIPFPEIEEQKAIVRAAKNETDKIDEVVSREKKEIDLLQELRTSLISEVVTGKIDVRQEVPQRAEVAA